MHKDFARRFFRMLADERGSQNAKSAVGIFFFFVFVGGGALLNSSSLPLSYNIAFGDSGDSGGGGGGGSVNNSGNGGGGGGGGGYSYSPKTKARIDYLRLTVHYDGAKKETKSLGSVSNDVSVGGTGWFYPENAGLEDGNRAAAEMQFGESSYYLRAAGFGFAVPKNARINGVTLDLKRSAEGPDTIKDYSIRLFANGKASGADYAKEEAWSAQDEFRSYGGTYDAWELQLSPDDVDNASFGVEVAARNGGMRFVASAQPATQAAGVAPVNPPAAPSAASVPATDAEIETLIGKAEKEIRGPRVTRLQNALITAARGPRAAELAVAGATGYYGPLSQKAAAEWRKGNQAAPVIPTATVTAPATPPQIPAQKPVKQTTAVSGDPADIANAIKTPLVRGDTGSDVQKLQQLLVRLSVGPEARAVAETGATGAYGWRTERAVAELQDAIIQKMKGPEAWKLAHAFFTYGKGSWGDATKAAAIEYLRDLR